MLVESQNVCFFFSCPSQTNVIYLCQEVDVSFEWHWFQFPRGWCHLPQILMSSPDINVSFPKGWCQLPELDVKLAELDVSSHRLTSYSPEIDVRIKEGLTGPSVSTVRPQRGLETVLQVRTTGVMSTDPQREGPRQPVWSSTWYSTFFFSSQNIRN